METLELIAEQRDRAAARVLSIEGRLVEARHDVSVARALRQEEQQQMAEINERRDGLIRDEVKFLAFVRPRSVDLVRRRSSYWRLEPFGVPAPLPAVSAAARRTTAAAERLHPVVSSCAGTLVHGPRAVARQARYAGQADRAARYESCVGRFPSTL